jgi:hypothetical protein
MPDKSSRAAGQVFGPDRPHKSLHVLGRRLRTNVLVTGLEAPRRPDMPSKPVWGRELPGGFDSRPPPLRRDQRKRVSEGNTIRTIGPVGPDVGSVVHRRRLHIGGRVGAGSGRQGRRETPGQGPRLRAATSGDTHGTGERPGHTPSCLTTADGAGGSCRP